MEGCMRGCITRYFPLTQVVTVEDLLIVLGPRGATTREEREAQERRALQVTERTPAPLVCSAVYAAQCMQRSVCSAVYAAQCMQRSVCSAVYAAQCIQRSVCSAVYAAQCMQRSVCSAVYAAQCMQRRASTALLKMRPRSCCRTSARC
jgi:L-aminopeptidase/D-esterase-like protein